LSVCSVDLGQAIIDADFFIKQITKCQDEKVKLLEAKTTEEARIANEKRAEESASQKEFLMSCSPSEYLAKTVFPHLMPALNAIDKERPNDPLAFLALHLLQNKEGINELKEITK
jgi:hypothetical protein